MYVSLDREQCGGGICHIHTGWTPEVQKALYPVLELQILEVHDIHLHYVYKLIHEIYPNYIGFFVHTPKKKWIPNWIMQILRYIGITNNSVDKFHCLLMWIRVVLFSQENFNFIWKPNNAGHFFLCRHSIVNFLCMK